jgi:ribosomal protein S18 acetylase RimI-like enzyme
MRASVRHGGVLDNPVWHSLTGPRRDLAERHGQAARFDPAVSPFAALPDDAAPEAWADLADLVGPGGSAILLRRTVEAPPGWEEDFRLIGAQMVAGPALDTAVDGGGPVPEPLGEGDTEDAMALIAAAPPGPFLPGTLRFGGYRGVRIGGRLVAMAGERMRVPGYTEVSAVCTHPDARGRGLGSLLTRTVVAGIRARGEEAFLHVAEFNTDAIRLYEALGFVLRSTFEVADLRPTGVSGATAPAPPPGPRRTGHPGSTTTSPRRVRSSG